MPSAPKGLRSAGKALWKSIIDDLPEGWTFDARELHQLARACRCQDELHDLEAVVDAEGVTAVGAQGQTVAHPALVECRQLRTVQSRLLGTVKIPDEDDQPRTAAGLRGQRAVRSRWDRRDRLNDLKRAKRAP